MSDQAKSNKSFSHAFLPGLILGLIVGAVAGAFLPDFFGGPHIPRQPVENGTYEPSGEDLDTDEAVIDPELEEALDEVQRQLEDRGQDAGDEVEDEMDGLQEQPAPGTADPASDG